MTTLVSGRHAAVEVRARRPARRVLPWVGQALSWTVMLGIGAILLVTVVVAPVGGGNDLRHRDGLDATGPPAGLDGGGPASRPELRPGG